MASFPRVIKQHLPNRIQQIGAKDGQERLDDVVDYIVNRAPQSDKAAIRTALVQKLSVYTTPASVKGFSSTLSMIGAPNAGNQQDRMLRRALILLLGEKGAGLNVVAQVKQTPTGNLQSLDTLIAEYALKADQVAGTGHPLMAELHKLKAHPLQFLRAHPLLCFGYNQFASGLQNVRSTKFYYNLKSGSFNVKDTITYSDPALPRAPSFQAVVIPAIPWLDVNGRGDQMNSGNFGGIRAVELTGADIMVTTQFSGCAFCFKEVQGRVFAAHISPAPNDDPHGLTSVTGKTMNTVDLARQLAGVVGAVSRGDFASPVPTGGQFNVYGKGYSNITGHGSGYDQTTAGIRGFMTIIGVRKGNWRFYSQIASADGQVTSAVRIY